MKNQKMILPILPYGYDALEPVISQKIMELHHLKHHQAYVNGTNLALEKLAKSRQAGSEIDLREVLRDLSFNYNGHLLHSLFWQNLRPPKKKNKPSGEIKQVLEKNFSSLEAFQKEFNQAAVSVEGSGWAALVKNEKDELLVLQIEKHNLMSIVTFQPILVLDVWEHAYYLDYLNNRADYVNKWWQVVNWEDVGKKL